MKTLYIDCGMGAAGDMLSAALLDLLPDPEQAVKEMNSFGIPGVEYRYERTSRCGIAAARLAVSVHGEEELHGGHAHTHAHAHSHAHSHAHAHGHTHRGLEEVLGAIGALSVPGKVASAASETYRLIAGAESRVHGRAVGEVHFHEVGALDAIADIVASCWLMDRIAPDETVASPVNVGGGTVRCAHGTLPVPAPATALLLEGVPSFGDGEIGCELCTPTGAALLRRFADRFGPMPLMRTEKTGYGAGSRDFEGRANLLRCTIGERGGGDLEDEVCEIVCNIDDMTGEAVAFACERIFAAGALDVLTVPAAMKKGRPGMVMEAICRPEARDDVVRAVFRHTSTLGVRERMCRRRILKRSEDEVALPGGTVRRKTAEGYGVRREKFEHDDLAAIARASGAGLEETVNACRHL